MSIRITTGMIASGYNKNLNQSRFDLSKAQRQAYTYRAFEQVSDNPFAAGQTFQIRRATEMNEDYQSNLDNVQSAVTTAESTLQNVFSVLSNANSSGVLKAVNGTMNDTNRAEIATSLLKMRDTVLADMNQQYADEYLFAGAGTSKAPFSTDADGNLLYRGINVDTGENTNGASATINYDYTSGGSTEHKTMQINFGTGIKKQLDGYTLSIESGPAGSNFSTAVDTSAKTLKITVPAGTTKAGLQNYLNGSDTSKGDFGSTMNSAIPGITASSISGITIDSVAAAGGNAAPGVEGDIVQPSTGGGSISSYVDLNSLANEKVYVDIGLGLKSDAIDQTAYNAALPGINFLGYGMNSNNVSKNAYNQLTKMANILKNSTNTGTALTNEMSPYMDAFTDSINNFTVQQAEVGTKMNFLTSTDSYLTAANTNLQAKDENVEYVDPSDAIMNYYMQQYSYQAALQTGNSILQPTLLDFMK
jgi:flagellar hook-associated protein 3